MSQAIDQLFSQRPTLFVQQRKELTEILVDWETRNKYAILDGSKLEVGFVAERGKGLWSILYRGFLRSHRGLEIDVFDNTRRAIMHFARPFFFLFSSLSVTTSEGTPLGMVNRRFGILYKKYDLCDERGTVFATIRSPRWRLWQFPIYQNEAQVGVIAKRWGGALREIFTDADTFQVDFGHGGWTTAQRAVILAAAISIDFDFFENNQGSGGVLDLD